MPAHPRGDAAPCPRRSNDARRARTLRCVRQAVAIALLALPMGWLNGCVQSEYFGEAYETTRGVAFYDSFEDVDRPHEVIGRVVAIEQMASRQAVIDAMRRDAARRGAHAIVLVSLERFAWSDHDGPVSASDPELNPIGSAVDAKQRWRGEAALLRWTDPDPEGLND
jgi:uncharacterized protein YbjQ (UPF0145 family)